MASRTTAGGMATEMLPNAKDLQGRGRLMHAAEFQQIMQY
ncbi:MAG: hypothetical protein RLZZ78_1907 [Armatimonadota bacterium]